MPIKKQTKKQKSDKLDKPRCGLCGSTTKKLMKTQCCNNWICDDEDEYALFSYARNSCSRNHRRFTLCGLHYNEEHKGDWRKCKKCIECLSHEMEMYVWYGTNEYNFVKLDNPPKYKPTHCYRCGQIIVLSDGGYSSLCDAYFCENCEITDEEREKIIEDYEKENND